MEEYFIRCFEVKTFSGTMIEFVAHGNGQRFRERREITSFWEVLANESIRVFIQAAFPGCIWMSKIEISLQGFGNVYMLCEFFSVVAGDRVHSVCQVL